MRVRSLRADDDGATEPGLGDQSGGVVVEEGQGENEVVSPDAEVFFNVFDVEEILKNKAVGRLRGLRSDDGGDLLHRLLVEKVLFA